MPLQLSLVGKMPLQKSKLEICHSNFLIPLTMPFSLIPDHINTLYCHTYAYTSARTRKKKSSHLRVIPDSGGWKGSKFPNRTRAPARNVRGGGGRSRPGPKAQLGWTRPLLAEVARGWRHGWWQAGLDARAAGGGRRCCSRARA